MTNNVSKKEIRPFPLLSYGLGAVVLWSTLLALSLVWNIKTERLGILELARMQARTAFEKDVIYRRWNAEHGGLYAPVTRRTQPNPYLDVAERDITTPLGKKLTMINPAYMTRQTHEMETKVYGIKSHITSLNPIRTENAADTWENRSLKAFDNGLKEVSSVEKIDGEKYMRLMHPLITEKCCIKCHGSQGYKLGDIRGGISISIPMAPFMAISKHKILTLSVGHGLLLLFGLIWIGLGIRHLKQQIHKRIGVEDALLQSEERYRGLFERSLELVYLCDFEGNFIDANDTALEALGYTKKDIKSLNFKSILDKNQLSVAFKTVEEILKTGSQKEVEEFKIRRRDGEHIYVESKGALIYRDGKPFAIQGIARNITERKKTEDTLRESEKQASAAIEAARGFTFNCDIATGKIKWGGAIEQITGYTPEEFSLVDIDGWVERIHPDDRDRILLIFQEAFQRDRATAEYRFRTKNGDYITLSSISLTEKNEKGKAARLVGILQDITERKQAEEDLLENEAFNFALFQYNPIETVVVDLEGRVTGLNLAKKNSGDRQPNIGDVMYKDYAAKHEIDMYFELMRCIRSGKKSRYPERKYGDKLLSITVSPFYKGAIITSIDITKRVQAEEELKLSREKLRSLAAYLQSAREQERTSIAREIHDELGQNLTGLKMDVSWLKKNLPKDLKSQAKKIRSMMKLINETIKTTKTLISQLRPGLLDDLGLVAAIEWQAEDFQDRTGIKTEVVFDPEEIDLDDEVSTSLFRIFQEAITNIARHAAATEITASLKEEDGTIELMVRDNGKGITKGQISDNRSFGLLGIQERAHVLGGKVEITGVRGKGTTLMVSIPKGELL